MDSNIGFKSIALLPADIVLAPARWLHSKGIAFDADFFYNPARRVIRGL
jgi:hypothetical protein